MLLATKKNTLANTNEEELGRDRFAFILISPDNIRLTLIKTTEHFLSDNQNLEGYIITARKDTQLKLIYSIPMDGSKTRKRFPIIGSSLLRKIKRLQKELGNLNKLNR